MIPQLGLIASCGLLGGPFIPALLECVAFRNTSLAAELDTFANQCSKTSCYIRWSLHVGSRVIDDGSFDWYV